MGPVFGAPKEHILETKTRRKKSFFEVMERLDARGGKRGKLFEECSLKKKSNQERTKIFSGCLDEEAVTKGKK